MTLNKKAVFAIKLVIAFAAYGFVIARILAYDTGNLLDTFKEVSFSDGWYLLLIAILLMPIGWLFEAVKWQISIKDFEKVSLLESLWIVWYGVSIGLLTPNRIGEPAGRMAMVKPDNRAKAGVMAVICGMTQQLSTIIFGVFGLFCFWQSDKIFQLNHLVNPLVLGFLLVVAVITLLLIFGASWILRIITNLSKVKSMLKRESLELFIPYYRIVTLILLSLTRHIIFSSQFLLILMFFGLDIYLINAYAAIFSSYLFTSIIPSFAIGEVGVRASFAITFLGMFWINPAAIALSSLMVWLLNVASPGLIGVWFPILDKSSNRF